MKVRFARSAEADLEAIADWIAADDPNRALTFAIELRDRCMSLAQRPKRFPIARRMGAAEIRKLVHKDYLIFYVVHPDWVDIVHILHGARNWSAVLDA